MGPSDVIPIISALEAAAWRLQQGDPQGPYMAGIIRASVAEILASPDSEWFRNSAYWAVVGAARGASEILHPDLAAEQRRWTTPLRDRIHALEPSPELDADLARVQRWRGVTPEARQGPPPGLT